VYVNNCTERTSQDLECIVLQNSLMSTGRMRARWKSRDAQDIVRARQVSGE